MNITESGADQVKASFAELGKHTAFAMALTLNRLANRTQVMTREEIQRRLTLRRPTFVLNTIYRKPGQDFATKTKFEATVRVDDRRDVLSKFETGGIKGPISGTNVAIPLGVRRNKNEVITASNRPKGLMNKKGVARIGDLIVQFTKRKVTPLYKLVKQVRIPDRMNMRQNAEKVVDREFEPIATKAIDDALNNSFTKR